MMFWCFLSISQFDWNNEIEKKNAGHRWWSNDEYNQTDWIDELSFVLFLFCSILLISSNQDVDDYISLSGKQNQFYTEDIFDFLRENYHDDDDDDNWLRWKKIKRRTTHPIKYACFFCSFVKFLLLLFSSISSKFIDWIIQINQSLLCEVYQNQLSMFN